MHDLFPEASRASASGKPRDAAETNGFPGHAKKKTVRTYPTADAAIATLERTHGPCAARWAYHGTQGETVGWVLRWNKPDGKMILPVSLTADGWAVAGMAPPRPLYRRIDLAGAKRVYVTEGETAADAARSIGLGATTGPHGADSASQVDWSPLAGKEVVLLPDNDTAGQKYAADVARMLRTLQPAPTVKVVTLPNLPPKGDMADFVASNAGTDRAELQRQVEAMADTAEVFTPPPTGSAPEHFAPFPVAALPAPLARFVRAGCKALGCDASFLALPLLAVVAAMIGTSRVLELKRGWRAPAILWVAIVGESGTMKTPATKLVLRPIKKRQGEALKRYAEAVKQFEAQIASYEKAMATWKRSKQDDELPPARPEPPSAERCIIADATVESLAPILLQNRRGLLLALDELSGWFGGFGRYNDAKGADTSAWLSMYNAESIIVDRKTGVPRTIFVPTAAVSVCGGIQPGTLGRALGVEHRENGLLARLLLACPPRKAKRWTEAEIDEGVERQYSDLIDRLASLEPARDDDGEPSPVVLQLTADAKAVWLAFYEAHAAEQADLSGDLAAAWSKLEEVAARLALVFHCVKAVQTTPPAKPWLSDSPPPQLAGEVDAESMRAAVRLTEWFKHETRRVYGVLSESDEQRDQRRLVEWIERHEGMTSASAVQAGCRWLREPGAAEAALNELVKAGLGIWRDAPSGPKGGRPGRVFCLLMSSAVSETP